jgi:hypothetical protein
VYELLALVVPATLMALGVVTDYWEYFDAVILSIPVHIALLLAMVMATAGFFLWLRYRLESM